jgi:hypothetical protein
VAYLNVHNGGPSGAASLVLTVSSRVTWQQPAIGAWTLPRSAQVRQQTPATAQGFPGKDQVKVNSVTCR